MKGLLLVWGLAASASSSSDLDLAVRASGLEPDRATVLRRVVAAAVEAIPASGPAESRARALLRNLHGPGGPLRTYHEPATTLADILESGRFNCVSATVLYVLAGLEAGLPVEAELLPTHARARVWSQARSAWLVVETTSPHGFDPTPDTQRAIQARVVSVGGAERVSLVDPEGVQVGLRELVGAMYANRGAFAQAEGQRAEAERLFAASEALVLEPRMRRMLRRQRASLLASMADAAFSEGTQAGWARARDLLILAVELDPEDATLLGALRGNLRVAAERIVRSELRAEDAAGAEAAVRKVRAHLGSSLSAGLEAYFLAERARGALDKGDVDRALADLERARRLPLGPADARLREAVRANWAVALHAWTVQRAEAGDLDRALAGLHRIRGLSHAEVKARTSTLARLAGQHWLEAQALEKAAACFRRCPPDGEGADACRSALVATLQRMALPLVRAGRCWAAAPLLDELRSLGERELAEQARRACSGRGGRPDPKE